MACNNSLREAEINRRLEQIHRRLALIADIEAKAATHNGIGARGELDPERQRLIEETDRLLDELAAIGGSPAYRAAP